MTQQHFIYLLREREFVRLKEKTYKVGKTKQQPNKRFQGYPKGSEILLVIAVQNCDTCETQILNEMKKKFTQKKDYGVEYFNGDHRDMVKIILRIAGRDIEMGS